MQLTSPIEVPNQQKWILPASCALAVGISFCLFAFMASLIKTPQQPVVVGEPAPVVDLGPGERPLEDNKKVRSELKPKPETKTPPPTKTFDVPKDDPVVSKTMPAKQDILKGLGAGIGNEGISVGGGFKNTLLEQSDKDAVPIIQVEPFYPDKAARQGIEGWVQLSFSIGKDGSVTNIQIVDAEPRNIFNREAKQALRKWRYKAKFVDGAPVVQTGQQVRIDFNLAN